MYSILNISNHKLSNEQREELIDGAFSRIIELNELSPGLAKQWSQLSPENYKTVVGTLVSLIEENEFDTIKVDGFSPAIHLLVTQLDVLGVDSLYAYSVRESVETTGENGETIKVSIFKHKGFYKY